MCFGFFDILERRNREGDVVPRYEGRPGRIAGPTRSLHLCKEVTIIPVEPKH